uniref:ATP-dependent DNA helicase RecQ n=1 Tax=Arsenophonus endosymbiont of Trialeurodes vaporariorum TaxID=235567 RepID=A0A3B0LZY8_9GAMM
MRRRFLQLPVIALTATADQTTRNDIIDGLELCEPLVHISSFDRPNIRSTLVEKYKPLDQLWFFIKGQKGNSYIVYCNSRSKAEETAKRLYKRGLSAAAYHAGLDNTQRAKVRDAFQKDDLQVVVATVAFGMGINKSNVRFVVHFDIARNIESSYQETGRAGRDRLAVEAILFYDPADLSWLRRCLAEKPAEQLQEIERHKLNAMSAFAETQTCRRLVLLNYFGENRQQPCGNCDICLDPPKRYDGLIDAQKVLSCIYRTGQRFGIGYIVDILRGEVPLQLAVARVLSKKSRNQQNKNYQGHYDKKLFDKLRQLRKVIANEGNIPPFVVFNDATLIEMAERCPVGPNELLLINGVGQRKLARFGEAFMTLIRDHLADFE